ncbi:MAG: GWxTD domain-containing protein [Bacteroidetes bacterium]|nr:GWxTD domain-containing protein [Bacteroidota bacterium]
MPDNKFSIGDKVRILNERMEGVITCVTDEKGIVMVEGMELDFPLSQLVRYSEKEKTIYENSVRKVKKRSAESGKQAVKSPWMGGQIHPAEIPCIDLHIEKLLDDYSHFEKHEILPYQLKMFQQFLDRCVLDQKQKFYAIHGVGDGRLKNEIRNILSHYDFIRHHDAPYSLFGFGATEVVIGKGDGEQKTGDRETGRQNRGWRGKYVFFGFLLTLHFIILSASAGSSQSIRAYFSYARFLSPADGPYIETYLSVIGSTVIFSKNKDGKWQGGTDIVMIFRKDTIIAYIDKFTLLSPEISDSAGDKPNFLNQKRISLREGDYIIELEIKDPLKPEKVFAHSEKISISFPEDKLVISDIEPVESAVKTATPGILTKSGFDLIPYVSDFYPESSVKLKFYAEIYNTKKNSVPAGGFLLSYFLESAETERKQERFARHSRQECRDVIPFFGEFDIEKLPSGNYNLTLEIRDKTNNLLAQKKIFFQRSNPAFAVDSLAISEDEIKTSFVTQYSGTDSLAEHIRCLHPICPLKERDQIEIMAAQRDLQVMQKFFLGFWLARNGSDPEGEWRKYLVLVKKVHKHYATSIQKGYETDRGRVYLQYGEPNSIQKSEHEPSAYPYEIWHYYKIGRYSNITFVFIDESLAGNRYELAHSDMIGEIKDPKWQLRMYKRTTPFSDIDEDEKGGHYGGKAGEKFIIPK